MSNTPSHEHPDTALLTTCFTEALPRSALARPPVPTWRRSGFHGSGDLRCVDCSHRIAARSEMVAGRRLACAGLVVPASAGGSISDHNNVVPCCVDCRASKAARDLLEWNPNVDGELKDRQLRALQASLNHVVPLRVRTAKGVEAALHECWKQPRFRAFGAVFMQHGFLAWPSGSLPSAQANGLPLVLRRTFGAVDVSSKRTWCVLRLPREAFTDICAFETKPFLSDELLNRLP